MVFFLSATALATNLIIGLMALVLLLPISIFAIECLAALFNQQTQKTYRPEQPSQTAILIPAHNESVVIRETLACLMEHREGHEQIVVVADNCTDNTAAIAQSFGVTVLERQDHERRGKGYALDFGLGYLSAEPPDVVLILDADCLVQPGAIQALTHKAAATNRPVQACYLMEQPPTTTAKSAISALAFLVKNWVRPLGLENMSLPCLLTGTGMALPWSALNKISLASGNIVEDMQLSVDLAIANQAPLFCEDALVIGCLPQQNEAATAQRTRWEHGHLQTSLSQIPRLLKAFMEKKQFDLLAMALDFSVPPLSLLILVWLALAVAGAGSLWAGIVSPRMMIAISIEGIVMVIAVVLSWFRFGRKYVPAQALLSIPLYILWKIPLYFAFLVKPQMEWIRTTRDAGNEA